MLGVAYFIVDTGHLYIMPDATEREDFGLLRRGKLHLLWSPHVVHTHTHTPVLLQVQPRAILVSARIADRMEKVLTDYSRPFSLTIPPFPSSLLPPFSPLSREWWQ